jgi:hypothetical protein
MNKPTLTKEQAKAIESIKQKIADGLTFAYDSLAEAVQYKLEGQRFADERRPANELSNDDFIAALYVGYEVEQTPEEKVREYFNRVRPFEHHCEMQPGDFKVMAIKHTLNLLGIKIEGVND